MDCNYKSDEMENATHETIVSIVTKLVPNKSVPDLDAYTEIISLKIYYTPKETLKYVLKHYSTALKIIQKERTKRVMGG
jgi:hypothetical protein